MRSRRVSRGMVHLMNPSPSVDAVRLSFQNGGVGLLNVIIGLIMFGVALDLRAGDFVRIVKAPKGPMIGLAAQFVLLPAATYLLTLILNPAPSIALGMILVAACPGGNVSNFLTHFARGNTAMSVTMTACSTVAAVVMTPLNLQFWGSRHAGAAGILREIRLESADLFQTIGLILGIPIFVGMLTAHFLPRVAQRLHRPFQWFSIVAFAVFVIVAFVKNIEVFVQHVHWVALAVCLQNAAALAVGYLAAQAVRLPERDCRAISIEVGIQNSALGLALVFGYFDGLGGMALVAGWWGIWHVISGFTLASFWRRRPTPEAAERCPA